MPDPMPQNAARIRINSGAFRGMDRDRLPVTELDIISVLPEAGVSVIADYLRSSGNTILRSIRAPPDS